MSPDQLVSAREALSRGDAAVARKMVARVLLADPGNEQAWLLMARLANNRDQTIECLEHALRINPTNLATISALRSMSHRRPVRSATTVPVTVVPLSKGINLAPAIPAAPIEIGAPKLISLPLPEAIEEAIQRPRHKLNKALVFGTLIVLLVILTALVGPLIAPQDPMEEHSIIQVGDTWVIPPFNAFQVPGYILGSDQFGRDMLSRILFAVRPTLIMVSIVAIVRLMLGTLIGLGAGWSSGRVGRFLDGLISAALAVPILLVALGAVTMLGTESGLVTFIIGLSINGWGETARLVRQQTQMIKGQLFIESARSLGASTFQILFRHILRQIMPMVWMLFAFEISGTLMVTAGLGFLGYYIGGDVWIEVADFISRRTSGAPELGQMLATSWVNLLQPWPLVLTGSVVFLTILGFNLLGEGLRSRYSPEYMNRSSFVALLSHRFSLWFESSISYPSWQWLKANRLRPGLIGLAVVVMGASIYLYQTQIATRFNPLQARLVVPGGQIWASERVDPYGTDFLNSIGPSNPTRLWIINNSAGFSGNPVVAADGTIYVAGLDGTLQAVNPDGSTRWTMPLPELPVGSLALGPQGDIYVTGDQGSLSAYSPSGSLLWTVTTEASGIANHGAIVAPDGTIYYLLETQLGDTLSAVSMDGKVLWSVKPGTGGANTGLRLSPDGKQIFIKNVVCDTADGSLVDLTLPTQGSPILANQAQLFVGADAKTYLLAGHVVIQWTQTQQGFTMVESADWNYRSVGMNQNSGFPIDAGVTPLGTIWLYYSGFYGGTSIYWLDPTGKVLGSSFPVFRDTTQLVAIDGSNTAYLCGVAYFTEQGPGSTCEAYRQGSTEPVWTYPFPQAAYGIAGAVMAPGRLYVITMDGTLTALGDSNNITSSPTATP